MKKNTDLSVIIIAGNEAAMIVDCIKSADFADEIILVAANSSDQTIALAQKTRPDIVINITSDDYGKNFSKWRNLGLKAATGRWVFYLDADERFTPALIAEIKTIISTNPSSYFAIPRANFYLGQRVYHGGSYPDYVKRFFPRTALVGWQGYLHEEPQTSLSLAYLKNDLLHYTHRDLSSMLQKTNIWTDMEAQALFDNHHPPVVWWRFIRMFFTTFFRRYFYEQMYRDGMVGLISAIYESFDTFIIYAKLWQLQHQSS